MFHRTASGSRPVPNKRIEKPSNCTTTTTITGTRGACSELIRLITAGDDDRDPADGLPATSQHHLARIASVASALALALCPGVPALVARLQLLAQTPQSACGSNLTAELMNALRAHPSSARASAALGLGIHMALLCSFLRVGAKNKPAMKRTRLHGVRRRLDAFVQPASCGWRANDASLGDCAAASDLSSTTTRTRHGTVRCLLMHLSPPARCSSRPAPSLRRVPALGVERHHGSGLDEVDGAARRTGARRHAHFLYALKPRRSHAASVCACGVASARGPLVASRGEARRDDHAPTTPPPPTAFAAPAMLPCLGRPSCRRPVSPDPWAGRDCVVMIAHGQPGVAGQIPRICFTTQTALAAVLARRHIPICWQAAICQEAKPMRRCEMGFQTVLARLIWRLVYAPENPSLDGSSTRDQCILQGADWAVDKPGKLHHQAAFQLLACSREAHRHPADVGSVTGGGVGARGCIGRSSHGKGASQTIPPIVSSRRRVINPDRLAEMLAARDSHAQLRELVRQGSVFAHSIGDGGLPVSIGRTVAYHSRHCMVHAARE
ncbi:hypothetical protein PCL_02424 [Purpureocillium lilacinum]|uniref:Uncharacterized protein n=1 Tax=Purpureocillium lilacinum TaxID=33203 RepID=A0A2U3E0K4_PURLI|nr:hypothetical protein PCL_02424 [Purpureocillium lilacinum]